MSKRHGIQADRRRLLDSAPDVVIHTVFYKFWRRLLTPLWITNAAVAGYHYTLQRRRTGKRGHK